MDADTGFYKDRPRVVPGYTQRADTKRQRDKQAQDNKIINIIHLALQRGRSEAVAKRIAANKLGLDIKTVRKVWREETN
jgi:hypothetical protein